MTGQLSSVRMTECRDCAAPIRFVRLDTGSLLPVDPLPHDTGNVAARLCGNRLVGFVISKDHHPGPLDSFRLVPHHATCEARKKPTTPKPPPDPALF